MHAVGLHSALAIKRQRKRQNEQRRAEERRYSSQSGESELTSPKESATFLDKNMQKHSKINPQNLATQGIIDSKVVTTIGMLHVGIVFLVLGTLLLISGILPNDLTSWENKKSRIWWNELITIGVFSIIIGCFLLILNRIIVNKEENNLEQYVQNQLTRSKSGQQLEKDLETGVLNIKHTKHIKKFKNIELCLFNTGEMIKTTKSPIKNPRKNYPLSSVQENHSNVQSTLFLDKISEEQIINHKLGAQYFMNNLE